MAMNTILKTLGMSLLPFLLVACGSVSTMNYDRLMPAELTFPTNVVSVGIVDNVQYPTDEQRYLQTYSMLQGNGKDFAHDLAAALAETKYFKEVVLCESSLHGVRMTDRRIDSLAAAMQVDMLVVVHQLPIYLKQTRLELPQMSSLVPVTLLNFKPQLLFYTPSGSDEVRTSYTQSDSVYVDQVTRPAFAEVKREVPARSIPKMIKALVPSWTRVDRLFFSNETQEFGDAAIDVRERAFADALARCQDVYDRAGKPLLKAKAAFNCAVINERMNQLDDALIWLAYAKQGFAPGSAEAAEINRMEASMKRRLAEMPKLQRQMQRFEQ